VIRGVLTINEVILVHARLVQRTGGSQGIRDMERLGSAVARPQATFEGADLYPDLWLKAAALMHSLACNRPFVDGNKRTALTAAEMFLELNGHRLVASNPQAIEFTRCVVAGRTDVAEMAAWLRAHSESLCGR
jgi:death-on-curing protein